MCEMNEKLLFFFESSFVFAESCKNNSFLYFVANGIHCLTKKKEFFLVKGKKRNRSLRSLSKAFGDLNEIIT